MDYVYNDRYTVEACVLCGHFPVQYFLLVGHLIVCCCQMISVLFRIHVIIDQNQILTTLKMIYLPNLYLRYFRPQFNDYDLLLLTVLPFKHGLQINFI